MFEAATHNSNTESDVPVRIRHHFTGAVQSRGFRYACVKASGKSHVSGWVENQRDGSVVAETQGDQHQQATFLRRLAAVMPGLGSEWHDKQEEVPVVDGEGSFCVRR